VEETVQPPTDKKLHDLLYAFSMLFEVSEHQVYSNK